MNLRRLKYFVKIVDIGSLTQAAEVLHIAQPALSQQVATLEGEMDQQLLIRTKRGVTPTEAGKILYTHARTILRQCEQAQLAVHNVGQTLSGHVSIGLAPGTAASSVTMPLLQAVRADIFNDSGKLMDGVVMRAIQPFAALHSERAADSGRTVTPMPLAMAAVSVEMESISPMIFAVRRRSENASSTRTRTAL